MRFREEEGLTTSAYLNACGWEGIIGGGGTGRLDVRSQSCEDSLV